MPSLPPKSQLEEFDFEKANARFDKNKLAAELSSAEHKTGQADPEKKPTAYDSKSSFFDNISCESLEHLNQGEGVKKNPSSSSSRSLAEQHRIDDETFGRGGPGGAGGGAGGSGGGVRSGSGRSSSHYHNPQNSHWSPSANNPTPKHASSFSSSSRQN
jgi:protein LSM14